MKKHLLITSIIFLFLNTAFANLSTASESKNENSPFKLSLLKENLIIDSGLTIFTTDVILEKVFDFNYIEPNQYNYDISKIPVFDQLFMNSYSKPINWISNGTLLAGLTLPVLFYSQPKEELFTIGTMYFETLLWSESLKRSLKLSTNRARPYMYFENPPDQKIESGDWKDSFPSGHTTYAFASAVFTSYIFCNYYPNSTLKPLVISGSLALAITTGALRIASGNHFCSDVLTGAILGSFTGFIIPFMHKNSSETKISDFELSAIPYGFNLKKSF